MSAYQALLFGALGCAGPGRALNPRPGHALFTVVEGEVDRSPGEGLLHLSGPSIVQTPLIPYFDEGLKFSWTVRTKDVVRGPSPWHQCAGQIAWYDHRGRELGHRVAGSTLGTTDWKAHELSVRLEPKAKVRFVRFKLMLWQAQGEAWFDKINVELQPAARIKSAVPPLAEVENNPPVRWSPSPRAPMLDRFTSPLGVRIANDGGLQLRPTRGPALSVDPGLRAERSFTELDYGFMQRVGWAQGEDELLMELFRDSPILSLFRRSHLKGAPSPMRVTSENPLLRMAFFSGAQLVRAGLGEVELLYGKTELPIVAIHDARDTRGIMLFFPHPPELREWFIEDYLVRATPAIRVSAGYHHGRVEIDVDWRFLRASRTGDLRRHTFDTPVFIMPYEGDAWTAMRALSVGPQHPAEQGLNYWQRPPPQGGQSLPQRLLRMLRYAPQEFASWQDAGSLDLTYGHLSGLAWGNMTATMKGIRVDPLAEGALRRDLATRLLTFFLEKGAPYGAPTNLVTVRSLAEQLEKPALIRDAVFCQYWEFRMEEFRRWLSSDRLRPGEKVQVFTELQRAQTLFEPSSTRTWTSVLPKGGLWFDYFNHPMVGRPKVINTHLTSLNIAGDFLRLAVEQKNADADRFWRRTFLGGLRGLLEVVTAESAWLSDEHDENELRYAVSGGGPRSYHHYTITAWLPHLMEHSGRFAPEFMPALRSFMERLLKAKFLADNTKVQEIGRAVLERFAP